MASMKSRRDTEARSTAEQAAEWLLIMEDATDADRETFSAWLLESPTHVEAYLRAAAIDSLLTEVDPEKSIELDGGSFDDIVDIPSARPPADNPAYDAAPPARAWKKRTFWALAASVVLAVAIGIAFKSTQTDRWQHYSAAIGEQRTLTLTDGSVMYLGPGSSVDVRFESDERRLKLLAGAAMFQVHHDTTRPFRVHSGRAVVEAVGTQFNVSLVRGESVVSVVEGVVQVTREQSLVEKLAPIVVRTDRAELKPVRLAAGQETRVADDGKVAAPKLAAADPVNDWKSRRLTFINETLFVIADEFNRYNINPKIRIEDAGAGDQRYAAAFDADDPESLVTVLEKDPKLTVEHRGDDIVIRSR